MVKRKILILQDSLFEVADANAKLVFRIASQLCKTGYDVSILGIAKTEKEYAVDYNGIHLIHEPADRVNAARRLKSRLGRWNMMRYLLMPRTIWYRVNNKQYEPFFLEARQWLNNHVYDFDALIACCSPYYPLQLAAENADRIPVIYYKIDPVSSWEDKSSKDASLSTIENEIKWDNVASRMIMPDVVYRDYMHLPTKKNGHKVVVGQFPNVRRIIRLKKKSRVVATFEADKTNLLFVGKFYAKVRHPQYLFDLMEQLRNTNIVLHIVGPLNYMGFNQAYINKYFTNQVPNIRFHGAVPPEEADDILLYADGLAHVGNNIDTAMPSKILDYISSGKPILNICKIRTCPTIPLMKRYPMGMTIFEDEPLDEPKLTKIKCFLAENKGKQVPYEQIEKLYPECTIEYVGKQFDDTIQSAINEFRNKNSV